MKKILIIGGALILISFALGFNFGLGNQKLTFGDTGAPKNCRAYISASLDGYKSGIYTAEGALGGIEKKCGRFGDIWSER